MTRKPCSNWSGCGAAGWLTESGVRVCEVARIAVDGVTKIDARRIETGGRHGWLNLRKLRCASCLQGGRDMKPRPSPAICRAEGCHIIAVHAEHGEPPPEPARKTVPEWRDVLRRKRRERGR